MRERWRKGREEREGEEDDVWWKGGEGAAKPNIRYGPYFSAFLPNYGALLAQFRFTIRRGPPPDLPWLPTLEQSGYVAEKSRE